MSGTSERHVQLVRTLTLFAIFKLNKLKGTANANTGLLVSVGRSVHTVQTGRNLWVACRDIAADPCGFGVQMWKVTCKRF